MFVEIVGDRLVRRRTLYHRVGAGERGGIGRTLQLPLPQGELNCVDGQSGRPHDHRQRRRADHQNVAALATEKPAYEFEHRLRTFDCATYQGLSELV
jgi:hypothetical protein